MRGNECFQSKNIYLTSQSVGDSFMCDGIASPSFATLFLKVCKRAVWCLISPSSFYFQRCCALQFSGPLLYPICPQHCGVFVRAREKTIKLVLRKEISCKQKRKSLRRGDQITYIDTTTFLDFNSMQTFWLGIFRVCRILQSAFELKFNIHS